MSLRKLFVTTLLLAIVLVPTTATAQSSLLLTVTLSMSCGDVTFGVSVEGGSAPYDLFWEFGDGESQLVKGISTFPNYTTHSYFAPGEYEWMLTVTDSSVAPSTGMAMGMVSLGPWVTLNASETPFLMLDAGPASLDFTANVIGGTPPLEYIWSFEGASEITSSPDSKKASATYAVPGEYSASVTVTDVCGISNTDTLTVVVVDPNLDCHPMAKRIAEEVSELYPGQADQEYTCTDIYDFFTGGLTGHQLGFGRMWHAYKLAQTIGELSWEQILDWRLEGSGWGLLVQLDRMADTIEEVGIEELMARVASGEITLTQVRAAARSVVRYDIGFWDAIARLKDGASPGQLSQFYRVAQELELDPEELDGYLADGMSLSELRHAGRMASLVDGDWQFLAHAHADGHSWGEIKQAYRLAGEGGDPATILATGVKESRKQEREEARSERKEEREDRTAEQIADKYGVSEDDVMNVFNNQCAGDWKCVRDHFRENAGNSELSDKDLRTAEQLAAQYNKSKEEILKMYEACGEDWKCVRDQLKGDKGKGKGKKND